MLLVHQSGGVKVGEVVRYTVTYTPSHDRVLPTPSSLHLKVKNTSAIPLRAAWIHGPYTLHLGVYPSTFNPHSKVEHPERDGVPQYEPQVKAGGSWTASLVIPDDIREDIGTLGNDGAAGSSNREKSVTWIIEIASQILFSTSASVGFEMLIGRDERSVEFGFAAAASRGHSGPGVVKESPTEEERRAARRKGNVQTEGVYSNAIKLVVEDTETLWDKPPLPSWDEQGQKASSSSIASEQVENSTPQVPRKGCKRRKVHLVIITHGLHSNIGADMLFLKESIDATIKQARLDARKRKANYKSGDESKSTAGDASKNEEQSQETSTAPLSGGQEDINEGSLEEVDDDEEDTIVRGFDGNALRTGNGIQYLGKRLAKYILRFTYPDQPFYPVKRKFSRVITDTLKRDEPKVKQEGVPTHQHSTVVHPKHDGKKAEDLPYKFTSISFVGHSLGGLIQTYAIAYIQKHSPEFFNQIKPVNFICMASPMLGLSNENPLYVKFALDFGLIGRTGRDLGLSWKPTHVKGGWNAMISGLGAAPKEPEPGKTPDPTSKPLLRILPTGPAHHVLRKFRNRTVYSNVVNDGIVPLRTSCLLFLDWRGLGKVEKARRENGFVGTMAQWGLAELAGVNATAITPNVQAEQYDDDDEDPPDHRGEGTTVPLPAEDETNLDNKRPTSRLSYEGTPNLRRQSGGASPGTPQGHTEKGVFDTFVDFFRPAVSPHPPKSPREKRTVKTLRRAQTVLPSQEATTEEADESPKEQSTTENPTIRPRMPHMPTGQTRMKSSFKGKSIDTNKDYDEQLHAPPKTSIFESAGDILNPPLPSRQWLIDPSSRARTIFHDRVYHPDDIPPPPQKHRHSGPLNRAGSASTEKSHNGHAQDGQHPDMGGMKVEEKIARAYHRDLSWRKVLVRLEPDAHNNMVVRRMFANAYGWPVIKHLCDTHFADTYAAETRDENEPSAERAQPADAPIDPHSGEEVKGQTSKTVPPHDRTQSDYREARDELSDLGVTKQGLVGSYSSLRSDKSLESRQSSGVWDDSYLEGSDDDDSDAVDDRNFIQRFINPLTQKPASSPPLSARTHSTPASPALPLVASPGAVSAQRGLAPPSILSPQTSHPAPPAAALTLATKKPSADISHTSTKSTFDSADVDGPILHGAVVAEPSSIDSPVVEGRAPPAASTGVAAKDMQPKKEG